ncbi:MAG: DUF1926 domain-containing protein [Candidatus Heimdallarchaeota archaeon]|nr:DUF1926 domain-containing protein [Candidatus Heimdallarchaeota archaeon]
MTSKVNIAFIFHFHQPVDQFGWVNEEAYKLSYNPLLTAIENAPGVNVHLHFTGPLLEWLEEQKPEFMQRVNMLVKKGRVTIVGGGYSEPILSMIPEEYRSLQIKKLRDWWLSKYEIETHGCWLAERVWEPSLAKSLHAADVDFVFLDDLFIKDTGKTEFETFYSYFTEDQGKGVKVIPINEPIRYLIPWRPVEQTITYLEKGIDGRGDTLILIMSDAEKMGLWSAGKRTTHDICYVSGYDGRPWMDQLFQSIVDHEQMETVHIPDYLAQYDTRGLVYIPSASYDKMGVWVLPTEDRRRIEKLTDLAKDNKIDHAEDITRFAKGSLWRNFLVKYPETNVMHKRMLLSANIIDEHDPNNTKAMDEIIAAQSNDPYWHGMFGGAYYRFMRHSVFKHAIKAETIIKPALPLFEKMDMLVNGRNELIINHKKIKAFISPFEGGVLYELDDLDHAYNWLNIFTRKEESYHNKDVTTDRWIRRSLRDHFFIDTGFDALMRDKSIELGNFVDLPYTYTIEYDNIDLGAEGVITLDNKEYKTWIQKVIRIIPNGLRVSYKINGDTLPKEVFFVPEFNLSLNSHPYMTECRTDSDLGQQLINEGFEQSISTISLLDRFEGSSITLQYQHAEKTISYPIKTVSQTNVGREEEYQGTCILPIFSYSGQLEVSLDITITDTE